jgi:ATP-dependent 26S proteasome regulatory subunit
MIKRNASIQQFKDAFAGGYPVIAVETWEEDITLNMLRAFFNSIFNKKGEFFTFDLQSGLLNSAENNTAPLNPLEALDKISVLTCPGIFVFKDLAGKITDPEIQRRIKNIHHNFRGSNRFLVLLSSNFLLPPEIRREVYVIRHALPEAHEIESIIDDYLEALKKRGIANELSAEDKNQAVISLKGFTGAEIKYALSKICWGKKVIDAGIIPLLHDEKDQMARKDGVLEYVRNSDSINEIGGLENLKEWLIKRKSLFTPEAAKAGIRPPRGLLMMGISGCGKSLSVKAISALWGLPLFRLDMNKVYSGSFGTPEGTFDRAIKNIEAVAPAILWIDEIEGGISSNTAKDGGTGSHIFSAFLTWMQEKSSDIFVAATANRIDLLPAEIIRKGRFDQVFFIDLPNDTEREEIFKVHLKRRNNKLDDFDIPLLSVATEFWNGAEIEHVVEAATIEAFSRGEKLMQDDLYTIIRRTVPLSRTMAEQIKFIKNWASERAVSASRSDK